MIGSRCAPVVRPDWEQFLANIRREGRPRRVHYIEMFIDAEVEDELIRRLGLETPAADDPEATVRRKAALQRHLGYDYVHVGLEGIGLQPRMLNTDDTAGLARAGGRAYVDQHRGPITTWDEFEAFTWPDVRRADDRALQWCAAHLPDDMCVVAGEIGHFAEGLSWLMGYETLCFALFEQRDLVQAISDKLMALYRGALEHLLQFECVKAVWGSDDMGFRSGTLISPADLRALVLPGHQMLAELAHAAGRPYFLHSCGQLRDIMPDLIDKVGIDAKHSFEDVILPVTEAKRQYGQRVALLGGVDVDFLCRHDETAVRRRVRETLDTCMDGGGYCLGTGNSLANYIPLDNFLAMLDEGRRYT